MLDLHKENTILLNNKCQGILPTTMLEYLIIHNIFVFDVYMENIADMKFQSHHLHLEDSFIQQKHDKNFLLLC